MVGRAHARWRNSQMNRRAVLVFASFHPTDRALAARPCKEAASLRDNAAFEAIFESQRRAWRGSAEGVMDDARIYAHPWGFAVEDVRVPVRLWHGKQDRAFAVCLAEEIANRLPNCKARFIENEGHYSLPIRHIREILQDLMSV